MFTVTLYTRGLVALEQIFKHMQFQCIELSEVKKFHVYNNKNNIFYLHG